MGEREITRDTIGHFGLENVQMEFTTGFVPAEVP